MPQERHEPWDYQPFVKFYTKSWVLGSIRTDCTPEERSVFTDLLALSNEGRTRGIVQMNSTTPYPHNRLAGLLNVPPELLERSLKKFEIQKRVHENETGIHILSFDYYNPPIQHTGKRGRPRNVPPEQLPLEPPPTWTKKPDPKAVELWKKALQSIEGESSKSNFRTWFGQSVGLVYDGSKFIVGVPNNFVVEYIMKNQTSLVERVVSEITKKAVAVEYQIYESKE